MRHISLWFMVMMLLYWKSRNTLKSTEAVLDIGTKVSLDVNAEKTKRIF
jgi:hypothetical protein